MDRVLTLALGGCALFGALLVVELSAKDTDQPTLPMTASTRASETAAPKPERPGIGDLVQTLLLRPLFSATRKPPEQTQAGNALDPQMSNLRLTGIVIEPTRHLAIFAVQGAKPLVRSEGETLNDWRIDSIAARQVSLSGPSGTQTLEPKIDPSINRSAPTPLPVATPGSPAANGGRPAAAIRPPAPVTAARSAAPPVAVRGPTIPQRGPGGPVPPRPTQ